MLDMVPARYYFILKSNGVPEHQIERVMAGGGVDYKAARQEFEAHPVAYGGEILHEPARQFNEFALDPGGRTTEVLSGAGAPDSVAFAGGAVVEFGATAWTLTRRVVKSLVGLVAREADAALEQVRRRLARDASREISAACDGAGCICFAPGTQVLMHDGSLKAIEDIVRGDLVFADDPDDGNAASAYPVLATHRTATERLIHVEVADPEFCVTGGVIRSTGKHPFWTHEYGWIHAEQLQPGYTLLTNAGRQVVVTNVEQELVSSATYNLTIAGPHTYFVVAGGIPVLVHNVDPFDILFSQESIDPNFGSGPEVPEAWRGRPLSEAVEEARRLGRLPDGLTLNAVRDAMTGQWITLNNRTLHIAREANLSHVGPVDAGASGHNKLQRLFREGVGGPLESVRVRCP